MIAFGDHAAVLKGVGVVGLAAAQGAYGEAIAELEALDRGNAEDERRQAVFQAAEGVLAQPDGQTRDAALHGAAHGIPRRLGGFDLFLKAFGDEGARGAERIALSFQALREGAGIHGVPDAFDPGGDRDALRRQQLLRDAAGDADRRGHAAGPFAAAGCDMPGLDVSRIIRVAGSRHGPEGFVVRRTHVRVADHGFYGSSRGQAVFIQTFREDGLVRLLPRGGQWALSGRAPL